MNRVASCPPPPTVPTPKKITPSPFLLQRFLAFCGLSPSRGQQAMGAYNTHFHVHIMVGFLLGLGVPSGEMSSWGSSHKKIKIYSSWCTDWLFQIYLWGYWREILLFASPHSRMQGLTTNTQLEHDLYFISQSSSRKRERKTKTKSVFLMWSCLKVYMGYTVDMNVNCYNHYGEQYGGSLKN